MIFYKCTLVLPHIYHEFARLLILSDWEKTGIRLTHKHSCKHWYALICKCKGIFFLVFLMVRTVWLMWLKVKWCVNVLKTMWFSLFRIEVPACVLYNICLLCSSSLKNKHFYVKWFWKNKMTYHLTVFLFHCLYSLCLLHYDQRIPESYYIFKIDSPNPHSLSLNRKHWVAGVDWP